MVSPTLQWTEKASPIDITSRTDLEARLRDLASENAAYPIIAVLKMPDGSYGYIGLGRDESIMFLQGPPDPDGWTEEWIPIVEEDRIGVTEFFLLGQHHTEFESRNLMPIDDAIRAIGDFFESGSRPEWVRWEENKF